MRSLQKYYEVYYEVLAFVERCLGGKQYTRTVNKPLSWITMVRAYNRADSPLDHVHRLIFMHLEITRYF